LKKHKEIEGIEDDPQYDERDLVIVGTRETVDTAIELLQIKLKYIQKIQEIKEEQRNKEVEVQDLEGRSFRRRQNYNNNRPGRNDNRRNIYNQGRNNSRRSNRVKEDSV